MLLVMSLCSQASLKLVSSDAINNLSSTIAFEIAQSDSNALKLHPLLGVAGSTFATFGDGITRDSNNHLLIGAFNDSAFEVTIVADTTPPVIESLTLNLDIGVISFTFDEPVLLSGSDVTALSVGFLPNRFYSVSQATVAQPSNTVLDISLSPTELLSLLEFVQGRRNSVVSFTSGFCHRHLHQSHRNWC